MRKAPVRTQQPKLIGAGQSVQLQNYKCQVQNVVRFLFWSLYINSNQCKTLSAAKSMWGFERAVFSSVCEGMGVCSPVRGPMSGRVRLCWDSQLPHGAIPGRAVYCSQFVCLCIFASIGWVLIPFLFGHSSSPPQLPSLSSGLPLKTATKLSQQRFAKAHTYKTDKAVMWFDVMVGLKRWELMICAAPA